MAAEWSQLQVIESKLVSNADSSELDRYLEEFTLAATNLVKHSLDAQFRVKVSENEISCLLTVFDKLICQSKLVSHKCSAGAVLICLKLLRNLCAGCSRNQKILIRHVEQIVGFLGNKMELSPDPDGSTNSLIVKTGLQCLGNICVDNKEGQDTIFGACKEAFFDKVMQVCERSTCNVCCMILHLCILQNKERCIELCEREFLLTRVVGLCNVQDDISSEWPILLVHELFQNGCLLHILKTLQNLQDKVILVDIFLEKMDVGLDDGTPPSTDKEVWQKQSCDWKGCVTDDDLTAFIIEFITLNRHLHDNKVALEEVMKTRECTTESVKIKIEYLKKLILFLSKASSFYNFNSKLQTFENFLETVLDTLALFASLDGTLTSGQHRSTLRDHSAEGEGHPFYSLKSCLIKMIGNLCHENDSNKTTVNRLEGVQLVLNHCTIDHINPYITQWSVWAIRNLCHNHKGNQMILASMERAKTLSSEALEEAGLQVQVGEDGKIRVKQK